MRPAKKNAIILLGFGLMVLAFGLLALGMTDSVRCAGEEMRPGGICTETSRGATTTYTYGERQAKQDRANWGVTGFGVLSLVAAGYYAVTDLRNRRKEDLAAASAQDWMQENTAA
jgi:hypothetical protein